MRLVTLTLAELYLQQGHFARAIEVLETLCRQAPEREDLARRLLVAREALQAQLQKEGQEPASASGSPPDARGRRLAQLRRLLDRVQRRRTGQSS